MSDGFIPDHDERRFWSHVVWSGQCLLWAGGKDGDGYGAIRVSGRQKKTHRYAWFLSTGEWPADDLYVCHHCDTPACVNVAHLFLGTSQENTADKVAKGRQVRGEDVNTARITEQQAISILCEYTGRYGEQRRLAKKYDVDEWVISDLVKRRTWKHLDEHPDFPAWIEAQRQAKDCAHTWVDDIHCDLCGVDRAEHNKTIGEVEPMGDDENS